MRDTAASHGSGQKGWEDKMMDHKMMKTNRRARLAMGQHHWNQRRGLKPPHFGFIIL